MLRLILAFALIVLPGSLTLAAIPKADDPKAFTESDLRKAKLEFNRRTLTKAYQASGMKNPAWDGKAVAFLDAMAVRFTNSGAEDWYKVAGEKSAADLLKLSQAALDAGCSDPLVVYCHAVLLDDEKHSPAEVGPLVEQAAERLLNGEYPVIRATAAFRRLLRLTGTQYAQRRAELSQRIQDLTVTTLATWKHQELDRRFILQQYWTEHERDSIETSQAILDDLLALKDIDPWMLSMIQGQHEIRLGWAARGGGYANTVTEEGWKDFFAHIDKARAHLVAAHELRPDYPEAATHMITVSMAAGGQLGENARDWFDKAVNAQLDYAPAYNAYRWYLRPRWHGSVEEMYAFGVECLETRRFDTAVPWQLNYVLHEIADDSESSAFNKEPGVYENVKTLFEGYAASAETPQNEHFYRSYLATFAWRAGRYEEACRLFDELGDDFDEHLVLRVDAMPTLAVSHAYAMRDMEDLINRAEGQASRGHLAGASATYQSALDDAATHTKARYFLRSRLKQLQWQEAFQQGEWVDIQPDAEFIGWQPVYGQWQVDQAGGLVGIVDTKGHWLLCQAPFLTGDFVIEFTLELPEGGNTAGGVGFANPKNLTGFWGVWLKRDRNGGSLIRDSRPERREPVELQEKNSVRLTVRGNRVSAEVNGKQAFRNQVLEYVLDQPNRYLGLGSRQINAGASVRITGLRVRAADAQNARGPND